MHQPNYCQLTSDFTTIGIGVWLRHCATSRTVPGSIPCGINGYFFSVAPDVTMCPGVDSASENEYQGYLLG